MKRLRMNGRKFPGGNRDPLLREIEELLFLERRLAMLRRAGKAREALKGVGTNGGSPSPEAEAAVRRLLARLAAAEGGDGEGGGDDRDVGSSPRFPRWWIVAALVLLLGLAVATWLAHAEAMGVERGSPRLFAGGNGVQVAVSGRGSA